MKFREDDRLISAVVELHWATDTRRIALQLDRHITALSQNLVAERYQYPNPHILFSIHKNPTTRKSVQAWFKENEEAAAFEPFFRWFDFDAFVQADKRD